MARSLSVDTRLDTSHVDTALARAECSKVRFRQVPFAERCPLARGMFGTQRGTRGNSSFPK